MQFCKIVAIIQNTLEKVIWKFIYVRNWRGRKQTHPVAATLKKCFANEVKRLSSTMSNQLHCHLDFKHEFHLLFKYLVSFLALCFNLYKIWGNDVCTKREFLLSSQESCNKYSGFRGVFAWGDSFCLISGTSELWNNFLSSKERTHKLITLYFFYSLWALSLFFFFF